MTGGPRTLLHCLFATALLYAIATPARAIATQPDAATTAAVQRVLTLLNVTSGEYHEGVVNGAVQVPLEYEEARSFAREAQQRLEQALGADARQFATAFATMRDAIEAKIDSTELSRQADALRGAITAATGVAEDIYPADPPSASRGQQLFADNCVGCHGVNADGRGINAGGQNPPPANFTDEAFMRGVTPFDFFNIITVGRTVSAMPSWEGALSRQERWDLVSYVWTVHGAQNDLNDGQGVFLLHCAGCHGAAADGHGTNVAALPQRAAPLNVVATLAEKSDEDLFTVVTGGHDGSAPRFADLLSEKQRWAAVAFLRALALGGGAGAVASATDPLDDTKRLLHEALDAYRIGEPRVRDLVSDAYFRFEPFEAKLNATAPDIRVRVERRFLELRGVLSQTGAVAQAEAIIAAIDVDLDAARRATAPSDNAYALFMQSAMIILREGFEVVLVVGALLAYVSKSGTKQMRTAIVSGTAAGILASLAGAYGLTLLLQSTAVVAEVIEGLTLLLAAAVLFFVSYWLISKAEAEKWQRYIQSKVKTAVSSGSTIALAGAAFLAVFREGIETVLFYQALIAGAGHNTGAAVAGLLAGCIALSIVYVLFQRFGKRLPIRQFFLVTGGLLYYLSFVFAGRGVALLQQIGWVPTTPVGGLPAIELIGFHPTVETLVAQGILVACLLYGLLVSWRVEPPAGGNLDVSRAEHPSTSSG